MVMGAERETTFHNRPEKHGVISYFRCGKRREEDYIANKDGWFK